MGAIDRPPRYADAVHPYSGARRVGELVFVSGQLGVDAQGELTGDVVAETHQAIANLRSQLIAFGADLCDVVKINAYLADLADRNSFDAVYVGYFVEPRPTRTCIEAGGLPFGARVEIEAVACVPRPDGG